MRQETAGGGFRLFDFVRELVAGRRPPDPLPVSPGFAGAVLPASDAPEPAPLERPTVESPLRGQGFIIAYRDAEGWESERRIVLFAVYWGGPHVYLSARCLERGANRAFRVDRIRSVHCATHGDDLGDPVALFVPTETRARPQAPGTPRLTHPAIRKTLRALLTLSRWDGEATPGELDAVRRYLGAVLPGGSPPGEVDGLLAYADRLVASWDVFMEGVEVAMASDVLRRPFIIAAAAVATADGEICDDEMELLDHLAFVVRHSGVAV